jgi:hypothetical protein
VVLVLGGLALFLGLFLFSGGWPLWLLATLFAGVLCGTGTFGEEQAGGTYRFLASQRLPLGRVWAVRLGFWAAAASLIALCLLLAAFLSGVNAELNHVPGSRGGEGPPLRRFLDPDFIPRGLWLLPLAGLVWGFSVGQLFTLLWKKSIVVVVLSLLVSAGAVGLWLPSLVNGGLAAWQFLAVPVLLLVAGRLVLREWICERLFSGRSLLILLLTSFLATLGTAGALGYRVAEVPDVGVPFDVKEFEAGIPSPEDNAAGRQIRQALSQLAGLEQQVTAKLEPPEAAIPRGPGPAGPSAAGGKYHELLDRVRERGWAASGAELDRWLEEMFQGDWAADLRQAARLPLGVIQDPRQANVATPHHAGQQSGEAARLLVARALQLQSRGESAAALEHLGVVLALSRQLRHRAVILSYRDGLAVEQLGLEGLDRWLGDLGPKPDLLRAALKELNRHEAGVSPLSDSVKAEYLAVRSNLFSPGLLMQGPGERSIAEAVALAQQVPWEKERTERIVNAVFAGWLRGAEADYRELAPSLTEQRGQWRRGRGWHCLQGWLPASCDPGAALTREELAELIDGSWLAVLEWVSPGARRLGPLATMQLCRVRGRRLTLALALYQLDNGKPAATLTDLVPRYLPELPADPFTGESFHYRVSAGEQLRWNALPGLPEEEFWDVAPGQGIVWSTGPDLINDGGKNQGDRAALSADGWAQARLDEIFLVPRWRQP